MGLQHDREVKPVSFYGGYQIATYHEDGLYYGIVINLGGRDMDSTKTSGYLSRTDAYRAAKANLDRMKS